MGTYDSVYALGNWDTSVSVHLDFLSHKLFSVMTVAIGVARQKDIG